MKRIGIVALVALSACNSAEREPAAAPTATQANTQVCEQFPQEGDDGAPSRPDVPAKLASFVSATETTLTVQRDSGSPACIDHSYGEIDSLDSFAADRLLGVGISGHEFNSYLVVDRRSTADPVETGRKPIFSPDGKRFASVDISASGFGAFEGLGVWAVEAGSIRNLVLLRDLLDIAYDWQLERWASDDCLVFSAGDSGLEGPDERKFYELDLMGAAELAEVERDEACNE